MTVTSIGEERPLFDNPLEEPYFYQRYFKRWVKEGLDEISKIEEQEADTAKKVQGME